MGGANRGGDISLGGNGDIIFTDGTLWGGGGGVNGGRGGRGGCVVSFNGREGVVVSCLRGGTNEGTGEVKREGDVSLGGNGGIIFTGGTSDAL